MSDEIKRHMMDSLASAVEEKGLPPELLNTWGLAYDAGYQAATASTESKWRGVVENLQDAASVGRSYVSAAYTQTGGASALREMSAIDDALTEAAQMLGGK